ncbi:MAG: hypothetical protein DHS20C19_05180 [Acidimicrobiales bacterium]|nr:MAG: hypothetical protein DHS20C19_05180 [Acidimicrobiales bacterium]
MLLGAILLVAAMGVTPSIVSGQPTVVEDPGDGATSTSTSAPAVERISDPTTTTTLVGPIQVQLVADPRPGDLRVDPNGDVLPSDYEPTNAREVRRDVEYGPDPYHRYDLYLPADDGAPLIVYLHSGGWIGGDRSYVPPMVLRFLELGYAVASVEYRIAPDSTFPEPVEDVKRAIRELKAMGAETGLVDPDRVVVYGTSAGGHLGAFAAATVGEFEPTDLSPTAQAFDSSVAALVSAVGPTDLVQMYSHPNAWAAPMTGTFMGCFPTCTADQLRPANPAEYLHADLPPAYWAYGSLDPLVDADAQGVVIADAWAAAGAQSWLDIVENGDHNLDGTLVNQRAIENFLAQAVAG